MGRAAVRNRLAQAAQYEWLLLLDSDSQLPDIQFLARYAASRPEALVLVGGTTYEDTAPVAPEL